MCSCAHEATRQCTSTRSVRNRDKTGCTWMPWRVEFGAVRASYCEVWRGVPRWGAGSVPLGGSLPRPVRTRLSPHLAGFRALLPWLRLIVARVYGHCGFGQGRVGSLSFGVAKRRVGLTASKFPKFSTFSLQFFWKFLWKFLWNFFQFFS
jgi:hypothetical protein